MANLITLEDLKKAVPNKKGIITQEAVDLINQAQQEPEFQGESLVQSMITYSNVLTGTKYSITEYIQALKFCAFMVSCDDNYTEAYRRTFSDRDFVKERMDAPTTSQKYTELTSAASRYRRSKIVVDILTLAAVPFELMFTGMRYKAVGVLFNEMQTADYAKDRINAAKELLAATKGPDNLNMNLAIGPSQTAVDMQEKLYEQLATLAANQKRLLESGYDIKEVQRTGITLNVEVEE
jgi:hypothetical protein